jgi:hypothetical protein
MNHNKPVRYLYIFTFFMMTITGFGQMPIFKRYYIADIPGLGWLAKFYITHYMHYLFAILFLSLIAYISIKYLLTNREKLIITTSGYIRSLLLSTLSLSGILLVLRNFSGYRFSPAIIVYLDIIHLGAVILMLIMGLLCIIFNKEWLHEPS